MIEQCCIWAVLRAAAFSVLYDWNQDASFIEALSRLQEEFWKQ